MGVIQLLCRYTSLNEGCAESHQAWNLTVLDCVGIYVCVNNDNGFDEMWMVWIGLQKGEYQNGDARMDGSGL